MLRVLSAAVLLAATLPAAAQEPQAPASPQSCEAPQTSWLRKLFGPGEVSLGVEVRAVEVATPAETTDEKTEESKAPCACGEVLHAMGDCPCFTLFERMVAATHVEDTNADGEPCRNRLSLGVIPPPFQVLTGDATGIPVKIGLDMAPDELPHAPQSAACPAQTGSATADCCKSAQCCEITVCSEGCCQDQCAQSGCCALACRSDAACCEASTCQGGNCASRMVCGTAVCQQGCPVICGVPHENCPQTHNLQRTRSFVIALTARPKCGAASCKCSDCKCSGTECAGPTTGAWCSVTYSTVNGQSESAAGALVSVGDKWVVVKEDSQRECWIPADHVITIRTQPNSGAQRFTLQQPQVMPPQVAWRGPHQIFYGAPIAPGTTTPSTTPTMPATSHTPATTPSTGTWQVLPAPHERVFQIPLPPAPPLMPVTPSDRPITPPLPAVPPSPYQAASPYPATSYSAPYTPAQRAEGVDIESLTCSSSACAVAAPHVCPNSQCSASRHAECQANEAATARAAASQYCITISRFDGDKQLQETQMVTTSGHTAWMNVANFGIGIRVDAPEEFDGGQVRVAAYNPQGGGKPLAVAHVRLGDGLKLKWPTPHSKVAETVQIDVNRLPYAPAHAAVYSHPVMPPRAAPPVPLPPAPVAAESTPILGRFFGIRADAVPANPMEVRVYSVAELIASPPSGSPIAVVGGVAQHTPNFQPLVEMIKSQVEPGTWRDGGAVIHPFPQNYSLVIRQSAQGHEQIGGLLEQMRKLKYGEARTASKPEAWAPSTGSPNSGTHEKLPPAVEAPSEE